MHLFLTVYQKLVVIEIPCLVQRYRSRVTCAEVLKNQL